MTFFFHGEDVRVPLSSGPRPTAAKFNQTAADSTEIFVCARTRRARTLEPEDLAAANAEGAFELHHAQRPWAKALAEAPGAASRDKLGHSGH